MVATAIGNDRKQDLLDSCLHMLKSLMDHGVQGYCILYNIKFSVKVSYVV